MNIIGYIKNRGERGTGAPNISAAARNVRPDENISWQDAPDPVRASDFVTRRARMPKAIFLNIASIQAVAEDEFGYPQFAPQHTAKTLTGHGGQLAWQERSNIIQPQSNPYGNLAIVAPTQYYYPLFT